MIRNLLNTRTTREEFRDGMSRLPAAVNIITTDGPAGKADFTRLQSAA